MTPIERLQTSLTSLGLKAVEARLENLLEQAAKKAPGYAEFLDELLSCEVDARRTRYLRARLQRERGKSGMQLSALAGSFLGGDFSTGEMGNFHPALTP